MGHLHGSVGNSHGLWRWEIIPFRLVEAEIKQTRRGPFRLFRMFFTIWSL